MKKDPHPQYTAPTPRPPPRRFTLGDSITEEQAAFLDEHGYLVFDQVVSRDEVDAVIGEIDRLDREWVREGVKKVNGIPIFYGKGPQGEPYIQRFPFTSTRSSVIHDLIHDERFEPVRRLIGEDTRIGDVEKDGSVISRYINTKGSVYPRLGWHTDGLRDIFYGRMPQQMLNVGIHFDDCSIEDGGLRLIPGTHKQGFRDTLLRKPYFISHGVDRDEIAVETRAGDLTLHDGRLWHRVERSTKKDYDSVRRVMYVPYLSDAYQPKTEASPTPLYHYLSMLNCWLKRNGISG